MESKRAQISLGTQGGVLWNPLVHFQERGTHCLEVPCGVPPPQSRGCPQLLNVANEHGSLRGGGDPEVALERDHNPILSDEIHLKDGEQDVPVAP